MIMDNAKTYKVTVEPAATDEMTALENSTITISRLCLDVFAVVVCAVIGYYACIFCSLFYYALGIFSWGLLPSVPEWLFACSGVIMGAALPVYMLLGDIRKYMIQHHSIVVKFN